MRNRVFEIVMMLIDYMRGDAGRLSDADDFWEALEAQGYSDDEISSAYSWLLKRFEHTPKSYFSDFPTGHTSNRILTSLERSHLAPEAHGLLIKLLNAMVISDEQFETIMGRVSVYVTQPVTLEQAKLIVSSVLFSELDEFDALALFDADGGQASYVT